MPTDLTRSLLVVLIPGAIGSAPWLFWLLLITQGYPERYSTIANVVGFGVAVILGLFFETLGTWIELGWDKEKDEKFQIKENWYIYLSRCSSPEPVGHRYLSRLVTGLYFELTMMVAVVPFSIGATALLFMRFPEQREVFLPLVALGAAALVIYFWYNARVTHELLCKTRLELNQRLDRR
jgi:predicted transporter